METGSKIKMFYPVWTGFHAGGPELGRQHNLLSIEYTPNQYMVLDRKQETMIFHYNRASID